MPSRLAPIGRRLLSFDEEGLGRLPEGVATGAGWSGGSEKPEP